MMGSALIFPGLVALLCGAAIFLLSPKLRLFHKFIGFTFVFEALTVLMAGTVLPALNGFSAPAYILYVLMLLVSPALYYFAVQFLLCEQGLKGRDFWMLLSALAFLVLAVPVVSAISPADKDSFQALMHGEAALRTTGVKVLVAVYGAAFSLFLLEYLFIQVFCAINISSYRKSLENYYSSLEGRSLKFVVAVLVLMGLRFVVLILAAIFPSSAVVAALFNASFALFYVASSILVCKIDYTAQELSKMAALQEAKTREPIANDVIKARLEQMIAQEFFLRPEVNLMDLALEIHVNTKYLSEYLKYHYNETFLAFVNRLRIDYSVALLKEGGLALEEIAERSGYGNVSTYYRNFTKVKGVPPSQFFKTA